MSVRKLINWVCLIVALMAMEAYTAQPAIPAVSRVSADSPSPQVDALGTMYYVSTTGDNNNPGTSSQPWRTIQKAADTMVAGDSTTVRAGNYPERVRVTRSGASGAPIAYQAEGVVTMKGFTVYGDYISVAGFDISDTADNWTEGFGIWVEGSYCVVEGNYVHFAKRGGIRIWTDTVDGSKASHCVVRNNRLYRNATAGIEVFGRSNLIEGNEIWGTIQYHPNWTNPIAGADADGMRFFGRGHTIRRNYIHDIKYGIPENVDPHIDCFQTWSDANHEAAQSVTFEQNLCLNLQAQSAREKGQGFMIGSASYLTIRNNLIQAACGINVLSGSNLTVVNNTFASDLSFPPDYGPVGVYLLQAPNTTVKNNAFYNFPSFSLRAADSASQQGLDAGYNLTYRSDGHPPSGSPYPHDLWQINPLFVNSASGDYHLEPNSPAIDAGIALAIVTDDFDGNPRPQGAGYDIGAYELPVFRKTALPTDAHADEIITFTISATGNGNPATVTDVLPGQLAYMSSSTTCPGTVTYDSNTRQVTYSGAPQAGVTCAIQISVRVATGQRMAVTNTAVLDNGSTSLLNATATVILNGFRSRLPVVQRLH